MVSDKICFHFRADPVLQRMIYKLVPGLLASTYDFVQRHNTSSIFGQNRSYSTICVNLADCIVDIAGETMRRAEYSGSEKGKGSLYWCNFGAKLIAVWSIEIQPIILQKRERISSGPWETEPSFLTSDPTLAWN